MRLALGLLAVVGWGSLGARAAPLGDLNCDGAVNAFDIDPFILALTDLPAYAAAFPNCPPNLADCNVDGAVNAFDIDAFIDLLVDPTPHVREYGDSGCLGRGFGCEEDDQILLTVVGNALRVEHLNAEYNCCPDDIAIALVIEGALLRFTETEVWTTPCFCVCCYDTYAVAVNLAPGSYTVEFHWFDYGYGPRCEVGEIVIP